MSKSTKGALFIVVAMAATCLAAQELQPEDVVKGVSAAAKSYLRDTTELPLSVATTTAEFDSAGKLSRTRHDTHRFAIVQARPDEYKGHGNFGAGAWVFHHGSVRDQMRVDMTAVVTGMLLREDLLSRLAFTVSRPGANSFFRVRFRSDPACNFEVQGSHLKLATWCGSGEYQVDPDNYALRHFSFEAAVPPVIDGKPLRGYRVEQTFQSVMVPGVAKPFVVPKTIITTYEKDKGKTVLTSDFTLLPSGSK